VTEADPTRRKLRVLFDLVEAQEMPPRLGNFKFPDSANDRESTAISESRPITDCRRRSGRRAGPFN
jgi:hypothetical protein